MPEALELKVVETYKNIPIIEVQYGKPTLLSVETHRQQVLALLDYPAEYMAVIVSYNNLSLSTQYGAQEQAEFYETEECVQLMKRALCILRYHALSLTSLVETMSAHALISSGPSNFAPDLDTAVRAARRTIESFTKSRAAEEKASEKTQVDPETEKSR